MTLTKMRREKATCLTFGGRFCTKSRTLFATLRTVWARGRVVLPRNATDTRTDLAV